MVALPSREGASGTEGKEEIIRKSVLEAKGVLPALGMVAVGLLWPRLSYEALKEGQRVNQELRLLGKDLLSSFLLAWIVL